MNKLTMNEYLKRKLDKTYLVIYAIKNEVNIKKGESIEKETIYTFIGIDLKGYRQLLNIYQDKVTNNRYWLECFEELKSRGLTNIMFLSVDDNKNIKRTAKIAYPNTIFVDSITDITPKLFKYSLEPDCNRLARKIYDLYTQNTLTDYKKVFDELKKDHNNIIHQKLIEKYLSNIENFYKYSVNIRKLLFKPIANIKLFDRIRISFNENKSYITELNEIYDKLENNRDNYFGFMSFKKKEWTLILNDLIQTYPNIDFI